VSGADLGFGRVVNGIHQAVRMIEVSHKIKAASVAFSSDSGSRIPGLLEMAAEGH
jgi:hypothetical protein